MERSVPWDVLRVGRFKSWTVSDGTFFEWDLSRAGPFVCAPCSYSAYLFSRSWKRLQCKILVQEGHLLDITDNSRFRSILEH